MKSLRLKYHLKDLLDFLSEVLSRLCAGTSSRCKATDRDESGGYGGHAGGSTGPAGAATKGRNLGGAGLRGGRYQLRQEGRT